MLDVIQKYIPAADTLLSLLGDVQRRWLNENVEYISPFLKTEEGKTALLMFLEELGNFVVKSKTPK